MIGECLTGTPTPQKGRSNVISCMSESLSFSKKTHSNLFKIPATAFLADWTAFTTIVGPVRKSPQR